MSHHFEVFLLDAGFQQIRIVEDFESIVWNEKFRDTGDFVLNIPGGNPNTYRPGRHIQISPSRELMIIKSAKAIINQDGKRVLSVEGETYETVFKDRVITTNRKHNTAPGFLATKFVQDICVDGVGLSSHDVIPHLMCDLQDSSTFSTELEVRSDNLFTAIQELCDSDGLGFRIRYEPEPERNRGNNFLVFRVTRGNDRTSDVVHNLDETQVVVFSEEMDNLVGVSHLRSSAEHKNVAYVWHDSRTNPLIVGSSSGVNRKVLSVDANDIENATTNELRQRGREALSTHNYRDMIDGEATHSGSFIYSSNYFLGDLVEVWYDGGRKVKSRVIEHIWSFDSAGLRAYPTLEYVQEL